MPILFYSIKNKQKIKKFVELIKIFLFYISANFILSANDTRYIKNTTIANNFNDKLHYFFFCRKMVIGNSCLRFTSL